MNKTIDHRRQEVQQIVKNACDQLNSEGVDARNYVEQLAWLFFLKAFDEAEARREEEGAFDDMPYERRLAGKYAWSAWAKDTDHPDQMLEFVTGKLWTKLTSPDPKKGLGDDLLAQRFRRIFENVRNYCRRGVSFAKVVQQVDKLHFSDDTDVHVLSEIYEDLLKRVAADSAGYAGEFYTQRHIVRAMVEVVRPQPGDHVYDPCFGTAGFLGETADFIRKSGSLNRAQLDNLQKNAFFGLENKPLTYLLGTMNMILHGIEGANLELSNTLEVHTQNLAEKSKYDVILSNPPYGGKMDQTLQTNFRVRSSATECLFVQHIMANLAKGGRAGVVIPEGVLFRGGPDQKVRKELLEHFNVHTILSLPAGCFLPYTGVKTNVIFFDRPNDGSGTKSVWFYDLTNDGFELKQTRKPINGNQIPDFLAKWKKRITGENSWIVPIEKIIEPSFDLSAKNPKRNNNYIHLPALKLVQSIKRKEEQIVDLLGKLEQLLMGQAIHIPKRELTPWATIKLSDAARRIGGGTPSRKEPSYWGGDLPWFTVADLEDIDDIQELTTSRECITRKGLISSASKLIPIGSIVFTSRVVVGKVGITKNELTTNQDFSSFVPNKGIDTEFLAYFLIKVKSDLREQQRGATIKGVTTKVLDAIDVPQPPIQKQRAIVSRIKECMKYLKELESLQIGNNKMIGLLREAILRKAFSGEL